MSLRALWTCLVVAIVFFILAIVLAGSGHLGFSLIALLVCAFAMASVLPQDIPPR